MIEELKVIPILWHFFKFCKDHNKMSYFFILCTSIIPIYLFSDNYLYIIAVYVISLLSLHIFFRYLDNREEITILLLNNWLQKVEKVKHKSFDLLMIETEKLNELCNKAKFLIPIEYYEQFPDTWEKQEEISQKYQIRYESPATTDKYYNHYLQRTEVTKTLIKTVIKEKCKRLKLKKSI